MRTKNTLANCIIGILAIANHKLHAYKCGPFNNTTDWGRTSVLSINPTVVSAQPIWSQWWKWSECCLFLLLYCLYDKKCAYILTPWHFFLLWFLHFGGMGTWFSGEYSFMSTSRIVQWSQLNAVFKSFGDDPNCKLPTWGKVSRLQVWNITGELVIQTSRKKETNRRSIPSTKHHVICTERGMVRNIYRHPQMG